MSVADCFLQHTPPRLVHAATLDHDDCRRSLLRCQQSHRRGQLQVPRSSFSQTSERTASQLDPCAASSCSTSSFETVPAHAQQALDQLALAIPEVGGLGVGAGLAAAALIGGLVLAGRVAVYGQREYITAAMLSKYVPRGGARVIQVGGSTREVFYYPKDTVSVVSVGEHISIGLMEQAGMQAQVPVSARKQSPANLTFQGSRSVDAVVVIDTLASLPNLNQFLGEVVRVLRPGGAFVFIERVKASGSGVLLQPLLGNAGTAIDEKALQRIQRVAGFKAVEWDLALQAWDPHAVGVARTRSEGSAHSEGAAAQKSGARGGRTPSGRTGGKGFAASCVRGERSIGLHRGLTGHRGLEWQGGAGSDKRLQHTSLLST